MKHINFISPVHAETENPRRKFWIGCTSAFAALAVLFVWLSEPPQDLKVESYPQSQLASASTSDTHAKDKESPKAHFAEHPPSIAQTLRVVQRVLTTEAPTTLQLIKLEHKPGTSLLTFDHIQPRTRKVDHELSELVAAFNADSTAETTTPSVEKHKTATVTPYHATTGSLAVIELHHVR